MAEETETVVESPEVMETRIRGVFEERLEIWKAQELNDMEDRLTEQIQVLVAEYVDKWKAEQKPLDRTQIQALLDQEYVEFTVPLRLKDGPKKLTIRELPQEAEEKFFHIFKQQIVSKSADVAALAQQTMDQSLEERIKSFLSTFDATFDLLAEATQIVLNYDGSIPEITKEWCQKNLSSHRMWYIAQAQVEANKLRDFFSQLFQSGAKAQTLTTPLDIQSLRLQLVK